MTFFESEGEWMSSLDPDIKAKFLISLIHSLTVAGRASYDVGGTGLVHPDWLRQINEIQHRVSACLSQVLSGTGDAGFEKSIASLVLDVADSELRSHTTWAWQNAKAKLKI